MVSRSNWRKLLRILVSCYVLFVVFGCASAPKTLQDSTTKVIFFSTKDFKFYDVGFVKSFGNYTALEIFNAGVLLLKMDCYNNKICLQNKCYAKDSIMRKFLGTDAFRELDFRAVLSSKEIFNGENKLETAQGFVQKIQQNGLNLTYEVKENATILHIKDSTKKTLFALEIEAH